MKRPRKPYSRLTVTLPTFLIIALREMVRGSEYSVSQLLEGWLTKAFSTKDLEAMVSKSSEFRRAAQAWLRWPPKRKRKPAVPRRPATSRNHE
jgi:hypothetical protein